MLIVLGFMWASQANALITSKKLDVLFVIDDSGSMNIHQQNLAKSASAISQIFANLDVNTEVLTTSVATGGKFGTPVRNSLNVDFTALLAQDVLVGTSGDSLEQPFQTLATALSPLLLSTANVGFLRADADLLVVFLTDTEDQSPILALSIASQLRTLKGPQQIFVVSGMPDRTNTSCDSENMIPTKITELTNIFQGQIFDICSPPSFTTNFSAALVKATSIPR
jgi:hypothetical protein